MATSGTTTFTMSRDEIIQSALRLTTRFSADDVIPPGDMANCAQALNLMCKSMVKKYIPLWCVQDVPVPLIAGQREYNLSIASGSKLPLRVLDCFLRNSNGHDRIINVLSRYDQNNIGLKTSPGEPNQIFYDPQLTGGIITLYAVPTHSTDTLHVIIQRQVQDFNLATDNPDFPQEALQMLKWGLADEIALEYSTPKDVRYEIASKAKKYREDFADEAMEQASVTFTPSGRAS